MMSRKGLYPKYLLKSSFFEFGKESFNYLCQSSYRLDIPLLHHDPKITIVILFITSY